MGVLNIRVLGGGVLASPKRPERLFVMTTVTDLDNEMRCAAAVRTALGDDYGTPAQAALRFVLGNRDLASRVVGIPDRPARRGARGGPAGTVADGRRLEARRTVGQRVQAVTPHCNSHRAGARLAGVGGARGSVCRSGTAPRDYAIAP